MLVSCVISGGQDDVTIQHATEVHCKDGSYLSSLSQQLSSLRDTVNASLSELVDKEKAANGSRKKELSELSDSGENFVEYEFKFLYGVACLNVRCYNFNGIFFADEEDVQTSSKHPKR